jgi:O-antigen/teichoic acid export membrane protein
MRLPTTPRRPSSVSAGLRLLTLPITGLSTLFFAHEIIVRRGSTAYAELALVWSIALLIQFADLGTGAAVVNAIAASEDPRNDEAVLDTIRSAVRVLVLSAAVLIVATVGVRQTVGWDVLLRTAASPTSTNNATTLVLLCIAVGLPIASWPRVLLGHGHNPMVVMLTALASPISLALGMCVLLMHGSFALLAAVPAVANIVVGTMAIGWIHRNRLLRLRAAVTGLWTNRVRSGVVTAALPMWIILVVQPAALQSDRIVLSWRSSGSAVATYSLAAQLYMPLLSVVAAAGAPLWPYFAGVRADRTLGVRDVVRVGRVVILTGTVLAILLALVGQPIAHMVGANVVLPGFGVFLAFALLLAVQTATTPFGMLMTDVPGLRFQAGALGAMLVVNLPLSWILAAALGDSGPVIGSTIAVASCQLLPCVVRTTRLRAQPAALPAMVHA